MAELADAQASGACGSNVVWVQVPSPALFDLFGSLENNDLKAFFFCKRYYVLVRLRYDLSV